MTFDRPKSSSLPYVSVIIPVFNAENYIAETIGALSDQTYPKDKFEIIVIDNGSKDDTLTVLREYGIDPLVNSQEKNPYISRNIGYKHAKGDIIVFLDITCTPTEDWLSEGVKCLQAGADLIGGQIEFTFSNTDSLGEWYDSISFVNVKKYIKEFNGTVAGNLFVKRSVIESIGLFPNDGRSGMDIHWTRKASQAGFKLDFAEKAVVFYPARDLKGVLKKKFRVGKGHISSWRKENKDKRYMWWETIKTYSPPSFNAIRKRISNRGFPEMNKRFYSLWFISWAGKVVMALGRTVALLKG